MFAKVVGSICLEFKPDNKQLARCLGLSLEVLEKVVKSNYELLNEIIYARDYVNVDIL